MVKVSSSEIDAHIGRILALYRIKTGRTLITLSNVLGVSFQQMQKYEKGVNKLSGANLYILSEFLGVDINYFFEDLVVKNKTHNAYVAIKANKKETNESIHSIPDNEFIILVKYYSRIKKIAKRRTVLELVRSLCRSSFAPF